MTTATFGRPSVEWLAGLFQKHGIEPDPDYYLLVNDRRPPCGCAVGALLMETLGGADDAEFAEGAIGVSPGTLLLLAARAGLPPDYVHGLSGGFSMPWHDFPTRSPEFHLGRDDGRAVRRLVLKEGGAA
jgi:hypothetical protein